MREEIIGDARLILGDCREVLPGLSGIDAVVCDPPYGISDAPIQGQRRTGKRVGKVNDWHKESWWDKSLNPEWGIVCDIAPIVAWFGQWRKREEVCSFMKWPLRAEIVWAKDCHMGPPSPVASRDERIWIFSEAGMKPATFETSVWDSPVIPTWEIKKHKNEKPVGLMWRLIKWVGEENILDPFMGSGTTGVACIKAGRKFTGVEIDEEHFDTACERISRAYSQPDFFVAPPSKPLQQDLLTGESP